MQVVLRVVDSTANIERKILTVIGKRVNNALSIGASSIENRIRVLVGQAIRSSPEYINLTTGGKLRGELGIIDPESALEQILYVWLNSIKVNTNKAKGSKIDGSGLAIIGIESNKQDVLSLPVASYRSNQYLISWLEWLLFLGDSIIIRDYYVDTDLNIEESQKSRTGQALMKHGGQWRMPPEFAGTANDNFVTRSLDTITNGIIEIIKEEFVKRL